MLGWSFRLGSLLGIPLKMHWTFLVLVALFMLGPMLSGAPGGFVDGLWTAAFILAIFGCVVLHELGHALAARMYGIQTRDITLLPIGGVARLEKMPERPEQELVVALAGPAVNVVIALLIIPGVLLAQGTEAFSDAAGFAHHRDHFIASLGVVNVALVVFNMIPAFPMDGGRVLRALLAMFLTRTQATNAAAGVGQAMAIVFAMLGVLSGNILLLLIALFVFLGAGAEAQAERFRSALEGLTARTAMMTRFRVMRASQTLAEAAMELLAGSQQDFPVLADDADADDDAAALVGVLTRADLVRGLAQRGPDHPVSEIMRPACAPISETQDLRTAVMSARPEGADPESGPMACPVIVVVRPDDAIPSRMRIVGLVTPDNVTEVVMLRAGSV